LAIWRPDTDSSSRSLSIRRKEKKNWNGIENIYPKSATELIYEFPQNSGLNQSTFNIYIRFSNTNYEEILNLSGIPATIFVDGVETKRTTNLISELNSQTIKDAWFNGGTGGTKITVKISEEYADQIDTGHFIMYIEEL
jgi:hypothetical protein